MAYVAYEPDPDYSEYEFGYGTFHDDKGQKLYGYDPELAKQLQTIPPAAERMAMDPAGMQDERIAMGMLEPRARSARVETPADRMPAPDDTAQDFQSAPLDTKFEDLAPRQSQPEPEEPETDQADGDPFKGIKGIEKTSPEFRAELTRQAKLANMNPRTLAATISHESGFNPSAVNQDTKKHGGLIQFSEKHWPAVARAAGRPEVQWRDMLGMSPEDQLQFVGAYYRGKGMTPDSDAGDVQMAAFMPGYAKESDDFVLGERGNRKMMGDVRSDKVYEQNRRAFDANDDGRITAGEVRAKGRAQMGEARIGPPTLEEFQARSGGGAGQPQFADADGDGEPDQAGPFDPLDGMAIKEARMQGMALTPEQEQARRAQAQSHYQAELDASQKAAGVMIEARNKLIESNNQMGEARRKDALLRQDHARASQAQARHEIDSIVRQPIQKINPRQYVQNMNVGEGILGAVAIALGQFGANLSGGPNLAFQTLQKNIDDNIDSQREAIRAGEVSTKNRLAYWSDQLGSAESGEAAARAEAYEAAIQLSKSGALAFDNETAKANQIAFEAGLAQKRDQAINGIEDDRRNRLIADFAPSKVPEVMPVGVGPNSPLWHDERLRQRAAQEFMGQKPKEQQAMLQQAAADVRLVDEFERAVDEYAAAYGAKFDENGKVVDLGKTLVDDDMQGVTREEHVAFDPGSSATGPGWSPVNWVSSQRDKKIEHAAGRIMHYARKDWKTEPSGEKWQTLFASLDLPVGDADVKDALERLKSRAVTARAFAERSNSPGVLAYMSYRDPSIMGKFAGKVKEVEGYKPGGRYQPKYGKPTAPGAR